MDKAIDNLMSPLGQLREEIMVSWPVCELRNRFTLLSRVYFSQSIKLAMETAIAAAGTKLARRAKIREEKVPACSGQLM